MDNNYVVKVLYAYTLEAYHHSKKSIIVFFGGLGFVWSAINVLISQDWSVYVFAFIFGIGILYALWKFVYWFIRVIIGRMTVSLYGKHNITLIRNGYDDNMDYLLHNIQPNDLNEFAFVMGIDKTGKLSISSQGGVVKSVMDYLTKNYKENPIVLAQKQIDVFMEKKENVDNNGQLAYGTCVEVHLNLNPIIAKESGESIPCNLILVANSRKLFPDSDKDNIMTDDGQSNIIVPKVFEYLYERNVYKGVLFGVLGTNGMGQTYQVVFSQIINQYARICFMKKPFLLKNLYISIRDEDYSNSKITLSSLEKYVRECAEYYSI